MKDIQWLGDSLERLREFPQEVRSEIGAALREAQKGGKHALAKPIPDWGPGVTEIVSDYHTDTYRAVYTAKLGNHIFVLHAFQKKSKQGRKTPLAEVQTIKQRLKRAQELCRAEQR